MTMVIAFNAVPPEKGGMVAGSIGIILTIGGILGPVLSGKSCCNHILEARNADQLCRCYL